MIIETNSAHLEPGLRSNGSVSGPSRQQKSSSPLSPQENGRRRREQLAGRLDGLAAILDERKRELVGLIATERDGKLGRVRGLVGRYSDRLEAAVALVESAIRSNEETRAPLFIQVGEAELDAVVGVGRFHTLIIQVEEVF